MKPTRAMSLLELLCCIALGMLVFYILQQLLFPTWRAAGRLYSRMELVQLAGTTMRHLEDDIQQATFQGLYLPDPPGQEVLVIHPLLGLGPDGRKVYSSKLTTYFRTPAGQLYRRVCPPWPVGASPIVPVDRPVAMTSAIALFLASPLPPPQLLCPFVTSFTVSADASGDPLRVGLELHCLVPGAPAGETCAVNETIHLRNH